MTLALERVVILDSDLHIWRPLFCFLMDLS